MSLYRLRYEAACHLTFEVIDQSRQSVIDRFSAGARAWCRQNGGTWADDAVEEVRHRAFSRDPNRPDLIEDLCPCVTVDGEGFWGYDY